MKKTILLLFGFLFCHTVLSQTKLFKGLETGMSVAEAKKEFKANKAHYTNIDLGNGFEYRIYQQNFEYDENNELIGVFVSAKPALLGLSYDSAVNHLNYLHDVFLELGYEIKIKNDFWNAPLNFDAKRYKYGLVLVHEEKGTTVEISSKMVNNSDHYYIQFLVWESDFFWDNLIERSEDVDEKIKESGF